ncbi:hypothetical protein [Polyangium sp. y55x31]|uniref:hypothetical protein n=1 Tax=Polyangium sp. y55x31 TaxID=3042688 RepID=UPI00248297D2|nr:hypothetical protein [Polyangium sp. y55x31]MDI1478846.1 hypothetical protein [Polyangium sp. y55x31]
MRRVLSVLAGCGLLALGGCIFLYDSGKYDGAVGTDGTGGAGGLVGAGGAGGQGGGACRVEWCFTAEEEASPCPTVKCATVTGQRYPFASDQDARGIALGKDPANVRIYVAGRYQGSMTIGSSNLMSEGGPMGDDGYVAVFGPGFTGVAAQSMNQGLGLPPRIAHGVAFGTSNQVIVGGRFTDATNELEGFVRAYSDDLAMIQWTQAVSGPGNDEVVAVAAGDSYAYAVATVTSVEGIDTDVTIPCASVMPKTVFAGEKHMVLLAYDAVGNCKWARRFSGGVHEPMAMTMGSQNELFVTGTYTGALEGTETTPAPETIPSGNPAMFLMKIDGVSGLVTGIATYGGGGGGAATPRAISSNGAGLVLVTGSSSGVVDFGKGPLVADKDSLFVLAASGTTTQWSSIIGGASNPGGESRGLGIVPSGAGGALVSGTFFTTLDFDPQNEGIDVTRKDLAALLARFDENGALQWLDVLGHVEEPKAHALPLAFGDAGIFLATGWKAQLVFESNSQPGELDIVLAQITP